MQVFITTASLLGGLAVFIFGIHLMSDGLQKAVGDKMRGLLSMLTSNPIIAALAGALTSIILQSSAATIMMVIGFVNTRLMRLSQAICVIIGANLGATVTVQITAFDVGSYAWIFVFTGFVMLFFMKKNEIANKLGQIFFGFGILFVGMSTMGAAFDSFASSESFKNILGNIGNTPVLGAILGIVSAFVLNSSAAVIGLLQNMAEVSAGMTGASVLGINGAIPIILGSNVGVALMTWLTARKSSISGKRAAGAHVFFNITGFLILIWFTPYIGVVVKAMSFSGDDVEVIARQIANVHLLFNLVCTVVFLPLTGPIAELMKKIVKSSDDENIAEARDFLDANVIKQPAAAIHMVIRELVRMGNIVSDMFLKSKKTFLSGDMKVAKEIYEEDKNVNILRERTVKYLSEVLTSENATDDQKRNLAALYHVSSDIEHIGDYCKNIASFAVEKENNSYKLSDSAYKEIYQCFDMVKKMMENTFRALDLGSGELADEVMNMEDKIDSTETDFRTRHIKRLELGECSTAATVIYVDTLHNLERIGDSCSNIADAVNRGYILKKENEEK